MRTGESTVTTRRGFLATSALAGATTLLPRRRAAGARAPFAEEPPPVAAAPPAASPVTARTFAEAERLAGVSFTDAEREQMLVGIDDQLARLARRRTFPLANDLGPAQVFRPWPDALPTGADVVRAAPVTVDPPARDEDIAFAPLTHLSHWLRTRQLTSRRLTGIYLDRLRRLGPRLECVITLTEDLARDQAARADAELDAGTWRGPLHGVPWGAKDLLDTAGIATTWGAGTHRDRVAGADAVVVRRLADAGAVLVAKLTLGALAYNDIWFGGRTRNPWNLAQGSSGSSAGSAAATVAGLVGFALGTETYGSIVSPCMRCGATGLRPTFGRVARTGAMTLCWSLDKIGPIARTVEDTALVLAAINGADGGDPSSIDAPIRFDAAAPLDGVRIGYDPAWLDGAHPIDRRALEVLRELRGVDLEEVRLPDWPYDALLTILLAEAAAAFDELTLTDRDDELVWQEPQAWPNTFRQARFIPALEYVQAERFRRAVCAMMVDVMRDLDMLFAPSFAGSLLLITNNTGHPSLTLRAGFDDDGAPHGVTLWGRLYEEGVLCRAGMALEKALDVWSARPALR